MKKFGILVLQPIKMDFSKEYTKEQFYWGTEPHKAVTHLLNFIKSGEALDLGIGEGKNAIFLAKNGFNIEGVDCSIDGLEKVEKLAQINGVSVKTFCADINEFKFIKKYDLIISTFTLHYLPKIKAYEVIRKIKDSTKKGGFNLIMVFTRNFPGYSLGMEKKFDLDLFEKNELNNLYLDWEVIKYSEEIKLDKSHGKPHYHSIALLIARKI